jgi:xanthine dehydrogenase accessory factor
MKISENKPSLKVTDIFGEILSSLAEEDHAMLATIIATTGSTPAAAHSKMLVRKGGAVSVGTVGGGCMEGEVLLRASRLYDTGCAKIFSFQLNEDDMQHGLICGGNLDILIEPITRRDLPLFEELKSMRDNGSDSVIVSLIGNDGRMLDKVLVDPMRTSDAPSSGIVRSPVECGKLFTTPEKSMADVIARAHRSGDTVRMEVGDSVLIVEPLPGIPPLVVFGGGHVAKYVSRAAAMAGFGVTIVDDREYFASAERFPEARRTVVADFRTAIAGLDITSSTYLLIVTRGHQYDEEILGQALTTPAKYIGMIGSKRKVTTTFGHLLEQGHTAGSLGRVHAPVGLAIGALTAEEIAISIVAELISVRRNSGPRGTDIPVGQPGTPRGTDIPVGHTRSGQ